MRSQINMKRNGSELFPTSFARFEDSYLPEPNTGCWLWIKSINKSGYGQIRIGGKTLLANRFSYRMFNGHFDTSLCVCHSCDTASCVNPNHLFLGTRLQNSMDRDLKGRVQRGSNHFKSKLDNSQVLAIRDAIANGFTHRKIAKYFNLKSHTITKINTGKSWKHI